MPHKNNITLGPGALYFNSPDGLQPLGEMIQEVTITEEPQELDIFGDAPKYIVPQSGEFTAELTLTPSGQEFLTNLTKSVQTAWDLIVRIVALWQSYPNRRVKHLAIYAKKPRTRKKNMRRIGRELLKEVSK